ncbi:MAG TPA: hypothetical protein ENJ08_02780 [Gammaproteobacteria bacterium]|nr:hypothetical protein [Gammaproteobacteria bacterium]
MENLQSIFHFETGGFTPQAPRSSFAPVSDFFSPKRSSETAVLKDFEYSSAKSIRGAFTSNPLYSVEHAYYLHIIEECTLFKTISRRAHRDYRVYSRRTLNDKYPWQTPGIIKCHSIMPTFYVIQMG